MKKMLNYFGYGTNRNLDMMAAMIGRKKIKGIPGKLLGHVLCIQRVEDISAKVVKTAPAPISPRDIIKREYGDSFELYITRPKKNGFAYGRIWKITPDEYELVRNWELLDFGMQHDIKGVAIDSKGRKMNVITHGALSPKAPINRIVEGDDYDDYIVPISL